MDPKCGNWHKRGMNSARILLGLLFVLLLGACGGRAFVYASSDDGDIRSRATTQTERLITVSAAVPSREEAEAIFGIDLYEQGIQPVWLEIENASDSVARYAPVSTDRYYFPPQEVVYKNRGGYSDEARKVMQEHFDALAMDRFIKGGETRSGFVFTHVDWGAKGFNVDVFNQRTAHHFSFLERVPGFVPDYANIKFNELYSDDDVRELDIDQFRAALDTLPCCSIDADRDDDREAINLVFVGQGKELLVGLLRSYWVETAQADASERRPDYLFDRPQDAIFRYESRVDDSIYEMRVWLAPLRVDGDPVWLAQVRHYYNTAGFRIADPDIDNARSFALQNLVYGQALRQYAWIAGDEVVPVESFWQNPVRPPYFTDGERLVLWLDAEPVSMDEVEFLRWDEAPGATE